MVMLGNCMKAGSATVIATVARPVAPRLVEAPAVSPASANELPARLQLVVESVQTRLWPESGPSSSSRADAANGIGSVSYQLEPKTGLPMETCGSGKSESGWMSTDAVATAVFP